MTTQLTASEKLQFVEDKISTPRITKYRHLYRSRQYNIWSCMKDRCNRVKNKSYKHYGGRGIKYDAKWQGFDGFWDDMKDGYSDNLSIDRIDNDGDYTKANCRWANHLTQSNNRSNNTLLTVSDVTKTISDWGREKRLTPQTIIKRMDRGWSAEKAVNTENKKYKPLTFTYKGETRHLKYWCKRFGVDFEKAKMRNWHGWSIHRILNTK